jgi:hypothetical protein
MEESKMHMRDANQILVHCTGIHTYIHTDTHTRNQVNVKLCEHREREEHRGAQPGMGDGELNRKDGDRRKEGGAH